MKHHNSATDLWNHAVHLWNDLPMCEDPLHQRETIWLLLLCSYAYDDIK